jgi:hypothetical protein
MAAPTDSTAPAEAGLGTRCAESQADGVPCAEIGTDCEICGRAYPCPHAAVSGAEVAPVTNAAAAPAPAGPDLGVPPRPA